MRRFLLPSTIIGLLAALSLLLPLVPLTGMKDRLVNEFSTILPQPCQILEVRLKLFPRPAISVQGITCSAPDFNLKARSLELKFSLLSLISFSPRIDSIHLRGVLAEIPFSMLFPELRYLSIYSIILIVVCAIFSYSIEKKYINK